MGAWKNSTSRRWGRGETPLIGDEEVEKLHGDHHRKTLYTDSDREINGIEHK